MTPYQEYISRKMREYPDKFDDSELASKFIRFYNSGARIEIDLGYEIKRGTVGITTGYKPVFLLMLKSNSMGSSITLSNSDNILKVIRNR